ncbi:hypothetical protein B5C34_09330 [Pacificimonas flava]|uniref:diguanylate cyclase n=2 Tax=Pacificimonas TaxID=1960290 RepID=A0A219B5T1_9SPHN|nr:MULTISPECIES: diguanylate cyclase [Pacificimonas]MBZ6379128.1 diguanylate cyclase [Pacificimonas aurantium]OWV33641.1 hypothetical protein B5C34_09330 [Pacificimonas flava]
MFRAIASIAKRLGSGLFPAPPVEILPELRRLQFERLRGQIPLLHGVGTFSMVLILWLAIHDGAPAWVIALLSFLPLFSIYRIFSWQRRTKDEIPDEGLDVFLQRAMVGGLGAIGLASLVAMSCYLLDVSSEPVVIPLSLFFGSFCIAFSFAPLQKAAVLALLISIVPSAVVLLASDDVLARMVAVSGLSVALLLIRFIREHFRQIVGSLLLERQVREQSVTDPLTGLLNRRGFDEALNLAIMEAMACGSQVVIAIADLDDFKGVNDELGHAAGDVYLRTVAERLRSAAGPRSRAARIGGDEFALIYPVAGKRTLTELAAGLLPQVARRMTLAGTELEVSISLGLAASAPADTPDTLLKHADDALYRAKNAGKNQAMQHGQDEPLFILEDGGARGGSGRSSLRASG